MVKGFLLRCGVCGLLVFFQGCAAGPGLDLSRPLEREKAIDTYISEFVSPAFAQTPVGTAIRSVFMRLPHEPLRIVMDRRRPVLFTEIYDAGMASFASSSEVIVTKDDMPAFQEGMTLIKLNLSLNEARDPDAIAGIVAHELAHRVLDHVRRGKVSCASEREANRLIKSWGFVKEYEAASREFGREKAGGPAACSGQQ